jgi:photosystem II stability/assembly factor-like uncharacterized protein
MYYTGVHEDGWRFASDLRLDTPDDSNWSNTGDPAAAWTVTSLLGSSDGPLYAGTSPNGDVFKSIDAGTTWVNTGNLAGAVAVWSLLKASDGALYAGTSPNGNVFKSIDAGTTWVNTGELTGAFIVSSLIEASDGALYAGTEPNGDVFNSIDAGTTWVNTGELAGASQVLALIEASDGALYAGTLPNGDVFKSIDAGATWINTGALAGAGMVWSLLEVSDGTLYAGTDPSGDVFRSTDAGTTWVNTGELAGAGQVYALIETSDGALYAGTDSSGSVFRSIDAGATWVNTGDLAGASQVYTLHEASDRALYAGTAPSGDIFKAGYFLDGELVSSVFQTENASVSYGAMTWNETLNGQTMIVKVRTDTLPDMSTAMDWGTCPAAVNGQDISDLVSVNDGDVHIQYRVALSTTRNDATPVLHDIGIEYTVDLEGPIPDPAIASDGTNPVPGIDDDDYVLITFDEPTNKPTIDALNIDNVVALSSGHSWLDGFGDLDTTYWNPAGTMLAIELSVAFGPPTVAVGDTVTPDGTTITDEWGNPAVSPVVITGSFNPPGVEETRSRLNGQGSMMSLLQNGPNPFVGSTVISYSLPYATHATLDVYDISGRLVETLVDEAGKPGIHKASWNASGRAGGVYFCKLKAGDFECVRKMVVID